MAPRHLLVIGGQRCGTTGLVALLEAHPDIAMAQPARPEPKVFMSDDLAGRGLDWYERTYFAHATSERLHGEKSTSYIEDAGAARTCLGRARRGRDRRPAARSGEAGRLELALQHSPRRRGPTARPGVVGEPRGTARLGPRQDVGVAVRLSRARPLHGVPPALVRRFPGHVHVRFLEDHLADPGSIGDLYAALGVDPAFRPEHGDKKVNESVGKAPSLDSTLEARLREYFAASDGELSRAARPTACPGRPRRSPTPHPLAKVGRCTRTSRSRSTERPSRATSSPTSSRRSSGDTRRPAASSSSAPRRSCWPSSAPRTCC